MILGAMLDNVQEQVTVFVNNLMNQNGIPASLMDKVLDGVQSDIRRIKSQEYANELVSMEMKASQPVTETKTGTVEDLKEELKNMNGGGTE